jgi:hypothetical protein
MTKPTPRADLVKAVEEAWEIVIDAMPDDTEEGAPYEHRQEVVTMRAAALPVILRELLDVEVR